MEERVRISNSALVGTLTSRLPPARNTVGEALHEAKRASEVLNKALAPAAETKPVKRPGENRADFRKRVHGGETK